MVNGRDAGDQRHNRQPAQRRSDTGTAEHEPRAGLRGVRGHTAQGTRERWAAELLIGVSFIPEPTPTPTFHNPPRTFEKHPSLLLQNQHPPETLAANPRGLPSYIHPRCSIPFAQTVPAFKPLNSLSTLRPPSQHLIRHSPLLNHRPKVLVQR